MPRLLPPVLLAGSGSGKRAKLEQKAGSVGIGTENKESLLSVLGGSGDCQGGEGEGEKEDWRIIGWQESAIESGQGMV